MMLKLSIEKYIFKIGDFSVCEYHATIENQHLSILIY